MSAHHSALGSEHPIESGHAHGLPPASKQAILPIPGTTNSTTQGDERQQQKTDTKYNVHNTSARIVDWSKGVDPQPYADPQSYAVICAHVVHQHSKGGLLRGGRAILMPCHQHAHGA